MASKTLDSKKMARLNELKALMVQDSLAAAAVNTDQPANGATSKGAERAEEQHPELTGEVFFTLEVSFQEVPWSLVKTKTIRCLATCIHTAVFRSPRG